jgi:hypothetical protein
MILHIQVQQQSIVLLNRCAAVLLRRGAGIGKDSTCRLLTISVIKYRKA